MKIDSSLSLQDLSLQYLLQTRRYLVFAVGFTVVAVATAAFIFFIQYPQDQTLWQTLQTEKNQVVVLQQKAATLEDTTFIAQADNRQKIDILLPSKKPLLQLLNNTGQAARDAQVILVAIETSPGRIASGSAQLQTNINQFAPETVTTKVNGVNVLTIGLTVNGTLPQINAFVKNIEQIAPISDITHLELQPQSDPSGRTDLYQAKMKIASSFSTQPVTVDADAPLPQIQTDQEDFLNHLDTFQFIAEAPQSTIEGGGLNNLFGSQLPTPAPVVAPTATPTVTPTASSGANAIIQ